MKDAVAARAANAFRHRLRFNCRRVSGSRAKPGMTSRAAQVRGDVKGVRPDSIVVVHRRYDGGEAMTLAAPAIPSPHFSNGERARVRGCYL